MSTIQEALKKAQIDIGKAPADPKSFRSVPATDGAARPSPGPDTGSGNPRTRKQALPLISAGFLAVAVAAAVYLFKPVLFKAHVPGKSASDSAQPAQEVSYRPLPRQDSGQQGQLPETALRPAAFTSGAPNLALNGIMYIEESPRAIINNSIVEAGDSISGARVVRIERKSVTLVYNDVEITLNLK